jgi:hypothetical protein
MLTRDRYDIKSYLRSRFAFCLLPGNICTMLKPMGETCCRTIVPLRCGVFQVCGPHWQVVPSVTIMLAFSSCSSHHGFAKMAPVKAIDNEVNNRLSPPSKRCTRLSTAALLVLTDPEIFWEDYQMDLDRGNS